MAKFDLSGLMATVSNLDTAAAAPELRMVALEDIEVNADNFYKLSNLGPLADSIAMDGLQQPLVVTAHPTKDGKYRLVSGHRRRAAIEILVKDKQSPREDLRLVPCMVKRYASPAMEELQLILANATARVLTSAEVMKQAEKMEILLYQLKDEGYEFPGRMRDQVAAACKVSAPKLARLKVIREKLISDFMYLFEKDKLKEQTAYALARMPREFQSRISKIVGIDADKLKGNGAEEALKKYEAGWRWAPALQCPDGKACPGGDRFLRHDLDHPYDMCGGMRCCLHCQYAKDQYGACDRMCSKAQALRKDKRDADKQQEDQRRLENAKKHQAETQENARHLLKAIDAAGLPDDSKFIWNYYWSRISVANVRAWADGEFSEAADTWTQPKLDPQTLSNPTALAQLLGCSTDFLLGLTEDISPAASKSDPVSRKQPPKVDFLSGEPLEKDEGDADPVDEIKPRWLAGFPTRSGNVVARLELDDGGPVLCDVFWFDHVLLLFHFSKGGPAVDGAVCLGWWPVPEDPGEEADNAHL